jgi:hypothetical protein
MNDLMMFKVITQFEQLFSAKKKVVEDKDEEQVPFSRKDLEKSVYENMETRSK